MTKAAAVDLQPGMLIKHGRKLCRIVNCEHVHVGGRGSAYIQVELRGIEEGGKMSVRFRTNEKIERPFVQIRNMRYLYHSSSSFVFMDTESYEQIELSLTLLDGREGLLQAAIEVQVSFLDDRPIAVELPASVVLDVVETEPRIKGATATASYKSALTATGLTVMVPPFIEKGARIRVSTASLEYQERETGALS